MALSFTVGGTRGTFEERFASEVAGVLENTFGAEGDWEGVTPRHFGAVVESGWTVLQRRAVKELGADAVPNLLALDEDGRGAYLPAHVNAISLPLSQGRPLCCASLPGLREELTALAACWNLPLDDAALRSLLDGAPEVASFARLALAANEAVRRDCPLWIVSS